MAAVNPLTSVTELADALAGSEADRPVVLDIRWRLGGASGFESYLIGHIPGAVFVDLDRDLAAPPGKRGRHPLPEAAEFERSMRRAGVSNDRAVVVYDDTDATSAARGWWCLRYFGHPAVFVLDGGYAAWVEDGQPTSAESQAVPPGEFTAEPGGMPILDARGAGRLARSGLLLDSRRAERYRGEVEPVDPVAGHIPGAVSAPTWGNVDGDGRFLSAAALRERFAELGLADGKAVGAYCGSGVNAAHQVLALELAGVPAALYVGSWSHWVTDARRPVAGGADPG